MGVVTMIHWIASNPLWAAFLLHLALSLVAGMVPLRYRAAPWYGWLLRWNDRQSSLKPPDVPGTLKIPGLGLKVTISRDTLIPPPLPILLALVALGLVGCPRLPQPDGCAPHEQRCHAGVPQICSQSARWTPADRACADIGATCCLTPSAYGGKRIFACVPSNRCVAEGAPQ